MTSDSQHVTTSLTDENPSKRCKKNGREIAKELAKIIETLANTDPILESMDSTKEVTRWCFKKATQRFNEIENINRY